MKIYVIYYNDSHIGLHEPRAIAATQQAAEREVQRAIEDGWHAYFKEKELGEKATYI